MTGAPSSWPPPAPPPGWPQPPRPRRRSPVTVLISVLGVLGAVVLAAGLALLVAGRMGDVAARQGTEAAAPRASSEEVRALAAGLEGAHDGVAVDWDGAVGSGPDLAAGARVDDAPGVLLVETTLGTMMGTGTGIVLSEDGLAITNYHVVEDSSDVFVTVADTGRRYTATVLGRDAEHDIAVLDVEDAADLTTTSVSRQLPARGDQVAAVGNGSGQGHLTAVGGEVLRTDQSIMAATEGTDDFARLTGLIQTDADVVPGYSGGPLVDAEGQVVGVTVAASEGTTAEEVDGFAIPLDVAFDVVAQVLSGEETDTVSIGADGSLGIMVSGSGDGV
ncbi:serine protease, partial [Micrococcus flavus]